MGAKWRWKGWEFFVVGTKNSHFFVTGQIGMKCGQKRQSMSFEESENLPLRGWFCTKSPFLCCFDGSPCHGPMSGLRFRLIETFRLLQEGLMVCQPFIGLLYDLPFRLQKPLKLAKFHQVNLNDRSPVTRLQITVFVFRLNCAFHLIVEGLTVRTLSGVFCMNYRFAVTRLLNHLPYFWKFRWRYEHGCQMLFTI